MDTRITEVDTFNFIDCSSLPVSCELTSEILEESESTLVDPLNTENIKSEKEEEETFQVVDNDVHNDTQMPSIEIVQLKEEHYNDFEENNFNIEDQHNQVKNEDCFEDFPVDVEEDIDSETVSTVKNKSEQDAEPQTRSSASTVDNITSNESVVHVVTSRDKIKPSAVSGKKPYECDTCYKSCLSKSNLLRHQRIHTGEKPFVCETCGTGFPEKRNLVNHERTHTGVKPFVCKTCGKAYALKSSLFNHEYIHTGERPFVCKTCRKSFIRKHNLITHELAHTADKPFVCHTCSKSFTQKSSLVTHERIHTGENSFVCKFCGKSCTNKSNLKSHERIHTGEKPYVCEFCAKCFNQKSNLVTHERNHMLDIWL